MFGAILKAAAPHLNTGGQETAEQKTAKLAVDVRRRMQQHENQTQAAEQTCIGLYGHWFLSLIALFECAARLAVHAAIVLLWFLLYYIVYCVSCGKAEVSNVMTHQMSRCSLYSGLFFSMLGNIFRPWKPVLYMFAQASTLARPYVSGLRNHLDEIPTAFDVENFLVNDCLCCCCNCCGCKRGHCVCCGAPPESALPAYKLAQASLFCVGCCTACGCHQCSGGAAMEKQMNVLYEQVNQENLQATRAFYQKVYQCDSFDALVARDVYGQHPGQPVYAQQPGQPAYGQQQPMQATIPVAIARPVR